MKLAINPILNSVSSLVELGLKPIRQRYATGCVVEQLYSSASWLVGSRGAETSQRVLSSLPYSIFKTTNFPCLDGKT
jgi:hypothetical protein